MMVDYKKILEAHDASLTVLRDAWMAAPEEDRKKWVEAINKALEERFRLMELRDENKNP